MVTKAEHIPAEIIEANAGADDLATEIKLRGEKSTAKGDSAGSTVSRKEDKVVEEPPAPKKSKAKTEDAKEEGATEVEPQEAGTASEPEEEVADAASKQETEAEEVTEA